MEDRVKTIADLYLSGLSARKIGSTLGISHTTVLDCLRSANIPRRDRSSSQKGVPRAYATKAMVPKECAYCGNTFYVKPGRAKRRKYCSRKCNAKAASTLSRKIIPRPTLTCEWCGKTYVPKEVYEAKSRRFCCHKCALAWNAVNLHSGTSIERTVCDWLLQLGIQYETQASVSKFFVDILIADHNLVIECDGDYWHSIPGIPERDRMRDIIIRRMGYKVLRLKGSEIKNRPEICKMKISNAIKACSNKTGNDPSS